MKVSILVLSPLLSYSFYFLIGSVLIAILVVVIDKQNAKTEISKLCLKNDISYGIYLYHIPLLQYLILFRSDLPLNALVLFLTYLTISLILGILRWIVVENPSEKLASRTTTVMKEK